ncbi:unnamed protein product [Hermetia illucens]|uniref:N-acetyllactosaminide beta-1,3-N-acetylglucosaminyltransferase n=1 Tax=Hermetia illucens TaxID=343691 RepID=A0A7R8USJ6_HERIL|nr:unnamed protein product [Hermetia illucens]
MSLKVFRTIFKFALIMNLVISLYMAVYLATDHLFKIQGKSLHRSNMIPQFNKLRNLTYKVNGSDLEERLRVNLISKRKVWLREQLQSVLKCNDRSFKRKILQRGDFWVFKNYILASHGPLHCFESVTYTTHGSYRFLRNLFTLVQRWDAPVSIAVYAPGRDFTASIGCIRYLRDCHPESHFIRYFVTFHLYFPSQHIPSSIPENIDQVIENPIECGDYILCDDSPPEVEYKLKKNLLYPVNVGRNIARDAALTHFILASDVELFPNPGLVNQFLEMIVAQGITAQKENHEVYAMPVFEIESFVASPNNKSQLQLLFEKGHAIVFHQKHCKECQSVSMVSEWIEEDQTPQLKIFLTAKRKDKLFHWEPIFIGTNDDPYYEERLSWEGLGEKMVQVSSDIFISYFRPS